jgi:hypothetical protein
MFLSFISVSMSRKSRVLAFAEWAIAIISNFKSSFCKDDCMNQGLLSVPEIAAAVGEKMLDYHLHRLELAGLIDLEGEKIALTEAGVAYGGLVKKEKEMGGADKI